MTTFANEKARFCEAKGDSNSLYFATCEEIPSPLAAVRNEA